MKKHSHVSGFTLIEVMLALLILAIGILGISKLQGTLVKNTSDANQRAVAVALAQKKIDDLRSYAELDMSGASDWSCPPNAATNLTAASLAYADIADNTGGAPLCDADLIANTDIQIGNTNYQLAWDVTPYEFVTNVATAMADASSAAPTVDFKEVEISVSWLDIATGNNASVAVSTILDAYNPALTALSGSTAAGGAPIYPTYTPEAAPDVIDVEVDTGAGSKRQTSKPLPDAVSQGQNANTVVTFEVVTYQAHPLDATKFTPTRQEEYITVDCKCTLSAADATAYPPAHAVWDDANKKRYDYVGSPISKPTATQTNNVNEVDEVCTACCRDHHDDDASPVKYVAGTASGNHVHYKEDGTVAGAGDEYVESCRLKLVDGVYRVYQNWNLLDFTVMNREDLGDGDALQTQYRSYVDQLLKNQIDTPVAVSKPSLRTPIDTAIGSIKQLQGRGIYIDNVYDLNGALSSEYSTYVGDSTNVDRLEKVPFAEVNLTLLSNWSSADAAKVSVTNEAIATVSDPANDYYGTYSRGETTSLAAAASPGVDITASIDPSNDGITNTTVNPSPPASASDTVAVTVSGVAPSPILVSGEISAPTLPNKTTFTLTGCGTPNNKAEFSCTIASGDNLNIVVTANYSITTGSGNNKITTPYSCSTSYSQSNVTTDITGLVITLSSCPP